MKINLIENLKTIVAVCIAVSLTGLGVSLILEANLGSDAINVFVAGLSNTLNLSIGSTSRIYNAITIVIALLLNRKNIGWATILYALLCGYAIDFFMSLIGPLSIGKSSLIVRISSVIFSQIIFTLAFALLIQYRKGMNQLDAIAYEIEKKTNVNYKWIRSAIDGILLVSGWLLGGVVGIGSVFAICTTGYLIDCWLKWLNKKKDFGEKVF